MGRSSMLLTTLIAEHITICSRYVHSTCGYILSDLRRHVSSYPIDAATDAYLSIGTSAEDTRVHGKGRTRELGLTQGSGDWRMLRNGMQNFEPRGPDNR